MYSSRSPSKTPGCCLIVNLTGQSLSPRALYEFTDMSVKEPYDSGWKDKVRKRIRRSQGAVNDVYSVKRALERQADGTLNFAQPHLMTGTGPGSMVTRAQLRVSVEELFRDDAEISLLYFSGHGYIDATGGHLCASDCVNGRDGLSLFDNMNFASSSPA